MPSHQLPLSPAIGRGSSFPSPDSVLHRPTPPSRRPPSDWITNPFLVRRDSTPMLAGGRRRSHISSPIRKREEDRRRRLGVLNRLRQPALVFALVVVFAIYLLAQTGTVNLSRMKSTATPTATAITSRSPARRSPVDSPFFPTKDPLPVHHDENLVIYHNYPLSVHRPPANQFTLAPNATFDQPVVALITATNNPRDVMYETATSLFGQSLQNFLWIIIDDHSTTPESIELLKTLARDPRVVVLTNPGQKGLAQSRNVGLKYILALEHAPRYIVPIDDDDMFEMTALEKISWLLESNPQWDLGGSPFIKWGSANETVWTGIHSGAQNYNRDNFVPNAAMFRTTAILSSGCRYDEESYAQGGEDWDFWMCLADKGHWGGSVPEPLYWYRMNPPTFRSSRWGDTFVNGLIELKAKVQEKHPGLRRPGAFPVKPPRLSAHLEPLNWSAPFDNLLAHHDKTIMFIVPWLYVGGADIGLVHMVQLYAEAGYRVTVACTLYKEPEGVELRPVLLQWTHDVHILPSFLRAVDIPRYLRNLILSRGIDDVVFSNSQLIYEMLPALVEQLPHVRFIDFLHNEAFEEWKSGGYPTYSVISQRYLARTITCSSYLRDWLVAHGHDASRIGVVLLGVELANFKPVVERERMRAKQKLLQLEPETIVVTFVGRLDRQKRPLLLPRIVEELIKMKPTPDFQLVIVGDGRFADSLQHDIDELDLTEFIILAGTVAHPQSYLAATDIFLLPSASEGISIAVSEAMAMGLPVITAHAGALPEQLGYGTSRVAGILVNHTLSDTIDATLYATALHRLLTSSSLRRKYGDNGIIKVATSDWRTTLKALFDEVSLAVNLPRDAPRQDNTPHPAVYLAIQTLLLEMRLETDFAIGYNHVMNRYA